MEGAIFMRFVVHRKDENSGKSQGLFAAMSDLEYEGDLLPHEQALYDETYQWFRENLRKPKRLSWSSRPHAKNIGISWFKSSAKAHIQKMRVFATILDAHGIETRIIRTKRPGYVIFEDEFQVVAIPFNETVT